MRLHRKLLSISYRDHITNDAIRDRSRIRQAIRSYDDILIMALPRQFYKEQCKEGEEGADKRSFGRIISLSGQG